MSQIRIGSVLFVWIKKPYLQEIVVDVTYVKSVTRLKIVLCANKFKFK